MLRRLLMLGVLMLCTISFAQTPAPEAPTVDPAVLVKGLKLLEAKEYEPARDLLLQATSRIPKNTKLSNEHEILANEALGVAYLGLQDYVKASRALEAALRAGKTTRALSLNATCAYLRQGNTQRALQIVDAFLRKTPTDETAVNLMGVALDAATRGKSRVNLTQYYTAYDNYNGQLEAERVRKLAPDKPATPPDNTDDTPTRTRPIRRTPLLAGPKIHRWGTDWLDDQEFESIQNRRRSAERYIEQLDIDLVKAQKDLETAKRDADKARRRSYDWDENYYRRQVNQAQHLIEQIQQNQKQAQEDMPRPKWVDTFELLPLER